MSQTVNFKTITQQNFTLDLTATETVGEVKKKIEEKFGEAYETTLQKLIYNGKILDDAKTVQELQLDASKFIVVMLSRKPAPAAAPPAAEPAPVAAAPAATPATPAPVPAVSAAPAAAPVPEAVPLTAEQEQSVEAVSGMGYPRDQVIAALKAAYWNPDRAVEFLLNGIPEGADVGHDADISLGGGDEGERMNLGFIRDLPMMNELRTLIRQNPEMLASVLQQLATMNPEFVHAIQANQQEFMNILNEPVTDAANEMAPVQEEAVAGGAAGGPRVNRVGNEVVLQLSQAENDAVQRIKSMGFQVPDRMIVEAYFACDKNEDATVDYILNNLGDAE